MTGGSRYTVTKRQDGQTEYLFRVWHTDKQSAEAHFDRALREALTDMRQFNLELEDHLEILGAWDYPK